MEVWDVKIEGFYKIIRKKHAKKPTDVGKEKLKSSHKDIKIFSEVY